MPQGVSWFDQVFQAPAPGPRGDLPTTPLEQTNPGLAKLRDLIGGLIGTRDALQPQSSNATVAGAAIASLLPLAGVLKLGQGEQAAAKAIKAYHGSPHDFDKFSLEKIGTGEGAQAYGHGLYFAENPSVAAAYKQSGMKDPRDAMNDIIAYAKTYKGDDQQLRQVIQSDLFKHPGLSKFGDAPDILDDLVRVVRGQESGGTVTPSALDAYKRIDKRVGALPKGRSYEVAIKADPDEFLHWDKPLSEQSESVRAVIAKLDPERMEMIRNKSFDIKGQKFVDDLAESVAKRANAPLLEQAKSLGSGFNKPDRVPNSNFAKWKALNDQMRRNEQEAGRLVSEELKAAGIKGIKYLDQGSRAQPVQNVVNSRLQGLVEKHGGDVEKGVDELLASVYQPATAKAKMRADLIKQYQTPPPPPTHNYVVFDDALIEIQKKYGVALPQAYAIKQWLDSQKQGQPAPKGDVKLPAEKSVDTLIDLGLTRTQAKRLMKVTP